MRRTCHRPPIAAAAAQGRRDGRDPRERERERTREMRLRGGEQSEKNTQKKTHTQLSAQRPWI